MFKRTEGVSTTDIVGKLLLVTTNDSSKTGGRDRTYSHEKPMRTSEYLKEARRKGQEELKQDEE